jgi:hypothetical protein
MSLREGDLFGNSTEFLSREMQQLSDLRFVWAGIQHQRDTLQVVYGSHSQLVKSLANNPIRYSPVFQMEDFFARYPGAYIDGAHVTFADVMVDTLQTGFQKFNGIHSSPDEAQNNGHFQSVAPAQFAPLAPTQYMTQNTMPPATRKSKKRRLTTSVMPYPTPSAEKSSSSAGVLERTQSYDTAMPNQTHHQPPPSQQHQPQQPQQHQSQQLQPLPSFLPTAPGGLPTHDQSQTFTQNIFSPTFNFSPLPAGVPWPSNNDFNSYDPHHALDHQTPSGLSASAESAHTDPDKDPFLSLLEQLAENEGMAELDFFLNAGQGLGEGEGA